MTGNTIELIADGQIEAGDAVVLLPNGHCKAITYKVEEEQ